MHQTMPTHKINPSTNNQQANGVGLPNNGSENQSSSDELKANQNQYQTLNSQMQQMRGDPSGGSSEDALLNYANNMLTENDRAIQRMNGSGEIVEHEFDFGRGGGNGFEETQLGNNDPPPASSPFIQAAKALLLQVLSFIKVGGPDVNPNIMIANYSQGSRIAELAKTLAEAGMTDEVVNGNAMLKHEALEVDSKAAGVKGEFDTQIQYWKDVLQGNKQAEKDTHDHARHG